MSKSSSSLLSICFLLTLLVGFISAANKLCFTGFSPSDGAVRGTCDSGYDTCKLKITYANPEKSFRAFPTATMGCVILSSDTDVNTGCSKCQSDSLLGRNTYNYYQIFSFHQEYTNKICRFKSDDGLSTVYCSQIDYGNRPLVVTTCYVGAFSAETPLKPTQCEKFVQDFCRTAWYTDPNGVVSAIGTCNGLPDYNFDFFDPSSKYAEINCIGENCNNVLICYTGTYYQKSGAGESSEQYNPDHKNTFKPSLCNYDKNQVCQTTVTYNALYGYAFQGACKAQGQCQNVDVDLTGDSNTVGTYCCTSQYCNSIKSAFQLNIGSNSSQIKSEMCLTFFFFLFINLFKS